MAALDPVAGQLATFQSTTGDTNESVSLPSDITSGNSVIMTHHGSSDLATGHAFSETTSRGLTFSATAAYTATVGGISVYEAHSTNTAADTGACTVRADWTTAQGAYNANVVIREIEGGIQKDHANSVLDVNSTQVDVTGTNPSSYNSLAIAMWSLTVSRTGWDDDSDGWPASPDLDAETSRYFQGYQIITSGSVNLRCSWSGHNRSCATIQWYTEAAAGGANPVPTIIQNYRNMGYH